MSLFSSLIAPFSPPMAFGIGLLVQALYKLVPVLDARGMKKLFGIIFISFLITVGGVLKGGFNATFEEAFLSFCIIFSGLLFFAFRNKILPKINELVLLSWNIGICYILLKNFGFFHPLILIFSLPTIFSFSIIFLNVKLNRFFQIGLYIWFMIMSIIVTFVYFPWSTIRTGFQTHHFSSWEMFFLGMTMYYVINYYLCLIAFVPFPQKRDKPGDALKRVREHVDIVENRYDEKQFHPAISFLIAAILVSILLINFVSPFVSEVILLGILFSMSPVCGEKLQFFLQKRK
jgi:hypothetical protein